MAWDVSFDPVDADEAIAWFAGRLILTRAQVAELRAAIAERAFYVSGVAQLDVVTQVWDAVDAALKNGTDLDTFKARVSDALTRAWDGTVDSPPHRIETIFRTNVQSAYSAGRHKQATDPETIADRPYWLFDGIADARQSEICAKCDGTIRPANDAWWRTHLPPLHFRCRSHFIALTQEQAEQRGITKSPPHAPPDDGFGAAPGEDEWKAPRSDYPSELWSAFKEKTT